MPEMVRHGYTSCTACHVSPAGDGNLTAHGRQFSAETLSTWHRPNEGEFAYNAITLPAALQVGGDVRGLAFHRNTPQASAERFMVMEAAVEVSATPGPWIAAIRAGSYNSLFQSRTHYLGYAFPSNLVVRAGRFQQAFGLMGPYHTNSTRRGLRWDEGSETYNLEGSWSGDQVRVWATLNLDGGALRTSLTLSERIEVGLSYAPDHIAGDTRHVLGAFANLGLSEHLYLTSELDTQVGAIRGWATFHRLGYEMTQGLHAILEAEVARPDFSSLRGAWSGVGLGAVFYPRPHFEFSAMYQKRTTEGNPSTLSSYATVLGHFYL